MIREVLMETLIRVGEIAIVVLPLLFLVEYLNHRFGDKLVEFLEKRKRFMPFWAGFFAILPGCNAAAAVAVLYARGLVSVGALIAAMIATSDEAIYVFIPNGFNFLPLFASKLVLAIAVGTLVDLFMANKTIAKNKSISEVGYCCSVHHHDHDHSFFGMLRHTLKHGIKIIGFVFIVLFAFNYFQDNYGLSKLGEMVSSTGIFQPFVAGLFGLLPGCGTSVVLATLYVKGILTFGGAMAGLSVASGDALLVLIGNKIGAKRILVILGLVLLSSVLTGYLIDWII